MLARTALTGLLLTTVSACALVQGAANAPATRGSAAAPISNALSARILGTGQTQTALVKALFAQYSQQVDAVLDNSWTPAFTDSLLSKPAVRQLLAKGKSSSRNKSGKAPAAAADVIPQARIQIEQRRAALHQPLEALQAVLLAKVDSQTRAMDAMNTVLSTGGHGLLPADISQSAMPPAAALSSALNQAAEAVRALQNDAAHSASLLSAWPQLSSAYRSKLQAVTEALGG